MKERSKAESGLSIEDTMTASVRMGLRPKLTLHGQNSYDQELPKKPPQGAKRSPDYLRKLSQQILMRREIDALQKAEATKP